MSPTSPKPVRRKTSIRARGRTSSVLPPQIHEIHEAALQAIRNFLKGRSSYDVFPLSSRVIVLDTKLEVKKALTCLLNNGLSDLFVFNQLADNRIRIISFLFLVCFYSLLFIGVVSAPLWNSELRSFAGMLTVSDIIHLIQYYYWTVSSYDVAAAQVEEVRLESLRGQFSVPYYAQHTPFFGYFIFHFQN